MIGSQYRFKYFDNLIHSVKIKTPIKEGYTKKLKD